MLEIQWFSIVATIVNLVILYFILRKFLFGPVHKILDAREEEVRELTERAEAREREASEMKKSFDDEMAHLEEKQKRAMAESNAKATAEYDRIIREAKDQAESIIEDATKRAAVEKDALRNAADQELADIVIAATAKMLADETTEERNQKLYDDFLHKAGGKQ
ncbi:MAG: hypothetical protein K5985_00640 [Lachnospiraceae bacterium]|nr:hypothetical protein [Lachnospiraceae bacterium]